MTWSGGSIAGDVRPRDHETCALLPSSPPSPSSSSVRALLERSAARNGITNLTRPDHNYVDLHTVHFQKCDFQKCDSVGDSFRECGILVHQEIPYHRNYLHLHVSSSDCLHTRTKQVILTHKRTNAQKVPAYPPLVFGVCSIL